MGSSDEGKREELAGREPTIYGFKRQRLTPTPLRPVDTYTLYYRREETKYNRSGCTGRALAFKTIGRGFAPRTRFVFFRHRRRVRLLAATYDLPLHI